MVVIIWKYLIHKIIKAFQFYFDNCVYINIFTTKSIYKLTRYSLFF